MSNQEEAFKAIKKIALDIVPGQYNTIDCINEIICICNKFTPKEAEDGKPNNG